MPLVFLKILVLFDAVLFTVGFLAWRRGMRRVAILKDLNPSPPASAPDVSVVFAARNEGEHIESAARSLLKQSYSPLQIIAVNDRSSDSTGAILDRLAAEDSRLAVLHLKSLPDGWLGKMNALNEGLRRTRGEWILFTDGDCLFHPETIAGALRFALDSKAEMVTGYPSVDLRTFAQRSFLGFMASTQMFYMRPWKFSDPKAADGMGVGAFNLVRKDALIKAGGFESLRLEIVDDVALGRLMKLKGYRLEALMIQDRVTVPWRQNLWAVVKGFEKNAFAVFHFRTGKALIGVAAILLINLAPFLGIFLLKGLWAVLAWWTIGTLAAFLQLNQALHRTHAGMVILYPFNAALFAFILLSSTLKTVRRGGVQWRGTFYPLPLLREWPSVLPKV